MMKQKNIFLVLGLVIMALIYRLIPHPSNFSPVNALFLFSGAVLTKKYGQLFLIFALVYLSDFILNNSLLRGFYDQPGIIWYSNYMLFNYISFALIMLMGFLINHKKLVSIIGGSITATLIFFFITNAGAWAIDTMNIYPDNLTGLVLSLEAGLPFLQGTLWSDLLFSGVFFGAYYLANEFIFDNLPMNKA